MLKELLKYTKLACKNFLYFSLGLLSSVILTVYAFVNFPVVLLRWLITKVLAPLCSSDLGKAVTVRGSFFASEFAGKDSQRPSRCAIVTNLAFEGYFDFDEFRERVQKRWINATDLNGALIYPEFQQCLKCWMGYMFWKQEENFSLDNHVKYQVCGDDWTDQECERFVCSLTEDLLNEKFAKGQSPWEVHLVNGYRNSAICPEKEMAVFIFRFHHCLADGFSKFSAICDGLFGIPLSECKLPSMAKPKSRFEVQGKSQFIWDFVSTLATPFKVFRDVGYAVSITLMPVKTHWFIPDEKKSWRQMYQRSSMIPMSKLKYIKDEFGVSFTAVLFAGIGGAISRSFKAKRVAFHPDVLPFGTVLPLKNHTNKLRNYATGALLEMPISSGMSPLQRIKVSERHFQKAKRSMFPQLSTLGLHLFGQHIAYISRLMFTNRTVSTALTNFPGSGKRIVVDGHNLVTKDFCAGPFFGVAGVNFSVISYLDHIRMVVVAEKAAMDRSELEEIVAAVCDEIETLYELAAKGKSNSTNVIVENIV